MSTWEEAVRWLRKQPDQSQLVRDCYYDEPALDAARRFHESEEWAATRKWFPATTGVALDLGAGHGIASFALAADGWKTISLEPDRGHVVGAPAIRRLADLGGQPLSVVVQRGEALPFRDQIFDLVYARQVLHHAVSLPALCKEVSRVLRPGATFVATREHVVSSMHQLAQFQRSHPLHWRYGGEHAYRLREYLSAVADAGLEVRAVFRAFDTVVNYAPFARGSLRSAIGERVRSVPGGRLLRGLMQSDRIFDGLLRLASRFDRRPGRLVSLVARRPGPAGGR